MAGNRAIHHLREHNNFRIGDEIIINKLPTQWVSGSPNSPMAFPYRGFIRAIYKDEVHAVMMSTNQGDTFNLKRLIKKDEIIRVRPNFPEEGWCEDPSQEVLDYIFGAFNDGKIISDKGAGFVWKKRSVWSVANHSGCPQYSNKFLRNILHDRSCNPFTSDGLLPQMKERMAHLTGNLTNKITVDAIDGAADLSDLVSDRSSVIVGHSHSDAVIASGMAIKAQNNDGDLIFRESSEWKEPVTMDYVRGNQGKQFVVGVDPYKEDPYEQQSPIIISTSKNTVKNLIID